MIECHCGSQVQIPSAHVCFFQSYFRFPPPTAATDSAAHKSIIHFLTTKLCSELGLHPPCGALYLPHLATCNSLHRLSTPKLFPFKPHLPHARMALPAPLNKQVAEPLTTTSVHCFLWDYQLFPHMRCPPLVLNPTHPTRKASLLHFSSLVD